MPAATQKIEIDSAEKVKQWLLSPVPAVFQGQDLTGITTPVGAGLTDCVFLGCKFSEPLVAEAIEMKCLIIPGKPSLLFDPFDCSVYSPRDLYDQFDPLAPETSYKDCADYKIYQSYLNSTADLDEILFRRIHDWSIGEALDDLLPLERRKTCVAIMGGHDKLRTEPIYAKIAHLTFDLTRQGYMIVTGGGPGLMEAANLGAYAAGFKNGETRIDDAIKAMATAPFYKDPLWLAVAFSAWKAMGTPDDPAMSRNVGIPTWYYGHEPPNLFATDIAKYFENNIREDGLLALALGGVIFAEGNAGTVQEIFQDACQNYYRSVDKAKSPMILLDSNYWNPSAMNFNNGFKETTKPKQAYTLLHRLATEKGFDDYLLMTDDVKQIPIFLKEHPPVFGP